MKRVLIYFILSFLMLGCGSKKKIITKKPISKEEIVKVETKEDPIVETENTPKVDAPKINSTDSYILTYKSIALEEMRKTGIPASITLAQGILESGSGKGRLAVEANNHFGIKCHEWTGKKIYHDDDEDQECFRKYRNAETSFKDHSKFLTGRKRYANLFKLKEDDYKGWAKELRKAGYATDKRYPQKLISLIERYHLYEIDEEVLGRSNRKKSLNHINHEVVKGDTLYSISKKYNLTVEELKRLNYLKDTSLSIGQILKIK